MFCDIPDSRVHLIWLLGFHHVVDNGDLESGIVPSLLVISNIDVQ